MLSAIVLGGFIAAAVVFLFLARLGSRVPTSEVWFAALSQAVLSAMLLRATYEGGILLDRTPTLVYAGFAALAVVWGVLRRETGILGPPAPTTVTMRETAWLTAVPVSGVVVSLVALIGDWVFAPEIVGLVQMFAFTAVWLWTRGSASQTPGSSRQIRMLDLKVFLSYRRDDSADVAGRLYDRLIERFGAAQVFKDVDSIPPGVDFRAYLSQQIAACDVVLAVIGARWLAPDTIGSRRIDDPKDFVRIELEAALERDVAVVPVLVGGAGVPHVEDLPETLAELAYRQAQVVRPDPDFHHDVDRLLQGLDHLASIAHEGSSGKA